MANKKQYANVMLLLMPNGIVFEIQMLHMRLMRRWCQSFQVKEEEEHMQLAGCLMTSFPHTTHLHRTSVRICFRNTHAHTHTGLVAAHPGPAG